MVGTARRHGRFGAPSGRPRRQERVILWPDTFNNFLHPETAKAAVEDLEHAGFRVVISEANLCCGRPLYDYGMLDTAKRWLTQILAGFRDEIEAGTPMIGLEPMPSPIKIILAVVVATLAIAAAAKVFNRGKNR
jgi:Fe-S oxidoreductase